MKTNLLMFCLSLQPDHLEKIENLNYIPVGLGSKKFSEKWFEDKKGENIANKNEYYGEYTFHYWLWKNYIDKLPNKWIGFSQYRKFFTLSNTFKNDFTLKNLSNKIIKNIPEDFNEYDVILGNEFYINQLRISKFLKRNFKKIVLNPRLLTNKNKRTIRFHFDMWHGDGNLTKAIDCLPNSDKNDFKDFVDSNVSFNPHNMFICKSKDILENYYKIIFLWLEKCEEVFGFTKSADYGQKRMYGFLAERFMSYWFKKNTKHKLIPIIGSDITNLK